MGCKPRFTKEQAEEITKLYKQGIKVSEIAKRYKSNHNTINNTIKLLKTGGYEACGKRLKFTQEQAEQMLQMEKAGMSINQIAKHFNCHGYTIRDYMLRAESKNFNSFNVAEYKADRNALMREEAAERMRISREKHKQQLDIIFDFCLHDIPEKGCANCPLCPAKLGFDVCGDQPPKSERLKKAIEIINKYREEQNNEDYA